MAEELRQARAEAGVTAAQLDDARSRLAEVEAKASKEVEELRARLEAEQARAAESSARAEAAERAAQAAEGRADREAEERRQLTEMLVDARASD